MKATKTKRASATEIQDRALRERTLDDAKAVVRAYLHIGPFDSTDPAQRSAAYSNGTVERILDALERLKSE